MNQNESNFFVFTFFKIDSQWRWMSDVAKEESATEFDNVMRKSGIKYRTYSTLGLRDDSDFLIWFYSDAVEVIQDTISDIFKSVFGKYIRIARSYLSSTRPSQYAKTSGGHGWLAGERQRKFVIVYPFIKTREWYLLPLEQRQDMMNEHIEVGRRYPQVILNTTYSFGIGDQDFMLAFETDHLKFFQDLIMDLRQTKVSQYVRVDTPMIVCVKKETIPLILSLG